MRAVKAKLLRKLAKQVATVSDQLVENDNGSKKYIKGCPRRIYKDLKKS